MVSTVHHYSTFIMEKEVAMRTVEQYSPTGLGCTPPTERKKLKRDGKPGDRFCTELGGRKPAGDEEGFGQGEVGVGDYACCGGGCLKRFHAA